MELHIPVSENFSLFAGIAEREADSMAIYPPESSLFDQLCTLLDQRPSLNTTLARKISLFAIF